MAHIAVEGLSFTYPDAARPALSEANLAFERGSYVVVCGESGSGKTTLLRHLKTVLTPHGLRQGRVLFEGRALDEVDLRSQAAAIGFVMQNPDAQLVTDKVWHELAFGLENLKTPQDVMRLRIAETASYFGIQDWLHADVRKLSGGQKQLLNLAAVMAMQPDVLILDEPTSQLDPIAANDFLNAVRRVNVELGTTVIMTEHRLDEVYPAADRIIVMEQGCVATEGSPACVALRLHAAESRMSEALPVPARAFFGVEASSGAMGPVPDSANASAAAAAKDTEAYRARCCPPLTVREGRAWLSDYCRDHAIALRSLSEEAACAPSGETLLSLRGVSFRYGRDLPDILRDASLEVRSGQVLALVGGNGVGKSTMLKVMCGVERPYRGKVSVMGRSLRAGGAKDAPAACVGMLPQDPQSVFVRQTVREDLAEMLEGSGLDGAGVAQRIDEVAQLCEIAPVLGQHPFDLSGGELQRAALAKVLLRRPRVLLLDEPTKGLDAFYKKKLAGLLGHLAKQGIAVVLVSHDLEFCASYADRVALLFDGSLAFDGSARSFFSASGYYTTAASRMSRPMFEGAVSAEDVVRLCAKV